MRVVLDTNVFVSALLGGRLALILDEWRAGKFVLIASEPILREYLDVISRPKFNIPTEEVTAIAEYLFKNVEFVTPLVSIQAVEADSSDNKFLEAAVEGNAVCVVSGDRHLLEMEIFRGLPIITANTFIKQLRGSTDTDLTP